MKNSTNNSANATSVATTLSTNNVNHFLVSEIYKRNALVTESEAMILSTLPKEDVEYVLKSNGLGQYKLRFKALLDEVAAMKDEKVETVKATKIEKALTSAVSELAKKDNAVATKKAVEPAKKESVSPIHMTNLSRLGATHLEMLSALPSDLQTKIMNQPNIGICKIQIQSEYKKLGNTMTVKPTETPKVATKAPAKVENFKVVELGKGISMLVDADDDITAMYNALPKEIQAKSANFPNAGMRHHYIRTQYNKLNAVNTKAEPTVKTSAPAKATKTLTEEEMKQLSTLDKAIQTKILGYNNIGIQRIQLKNELAKLGNNTKVEKTVKPTVYSDKITKDTKFNEIPTLEARIKKLESATAIDSDLIEKIAEKVYNMVIATLYNQK